MITISGRNTNLFYIVCTRKEGIPKARVHNRGERVSNADIQNAEYRSRTSTTCSTCTHDFVSNLFCIILITTVM